MSKLVASMASWFEKKPYTKATIISALATVVMALTSLVMVLVALAQLRTTNQQLAEARQKRVEAEDAAKTAESASRRAAQVEQEVRDRLMEIRTFQAELMSVRENVFCALIHSDKGEYFDLSRQLIGAEHGRGLQELGMLLAMAGGNIRISSPEEIQRVYLDAFELVFLQWLSRRYGPHWAIMDYGSAHFASGEGGGYGIPGTNDVPVAIWNHADICAAISDNRVWQALEEKTRGWIVGQVSLPEGSVVISSSTNVLHHERNTGELVIAQHDRRYSIVNRNMRFDIDIRNNVENGIGSIEKDILHLRDVLDTSKNWRSQMISVSFSATFPTDLSVTVETAKQKRWVEQLIGKFRDDFEWVLIERALKNPVRLTTPPQ
jgi:hypothetical protein